MQKRIFNEEEQREADIHQAKQEFDEARAEISPDQPAEEISPLTEENLTPARWWGRLFFGALLLLGVATLAQSIQWLLDTFQARQWIYFAFAIAFFGVSLAGVGVLINEWRKLVWLRQYHQQQQLSQQMWLDAPSTRGEVAKRFCQNALTKLRQTPALAQAEQHWLTQVNDAHNGHEVLTLFSHTVLRPIDQEVKKMISRHAAENAVIVAISPLAMADMLLVAWRNIALVNKITRAYGMELGYFSRLRLFRMVLTNMAFAGAAEIATDMGSEFFSQNLTAKISMRAAQGIGVGLLTARLGIQAMAFCRPVVFAQNERPTLSVVRQELLGVLKNRLFRTTSEKIREQR